MYHKDYQSDFICMYYYFRPKKERRCLDFQGPNLIKYIQKYVNVYDT
jgi:hypothetical protein